MFDAPLEKGNDLSNLLCSKGYGVEGKDTTLGLFLQDYLNATGIYYSKDNFTNAAPGLRFEYSNIGADLAAWIIELSTGVSFAQYTQQHILRPLHMTNITWSAATADQTRLATLYTSQKVPYPKYSSVTYPDGGLTTCCQVMACSFPPILNWTD